MKIFKYIISAIVLLTAIPSFGQMINGGFEQYDFDDNNDGIDDDWYIYSLEYAIGWHNCPLAGSSPPNYSNSCDLIHAATIANGTPRTGVGCGGFGAVGNGNNEFCYGTTAPLVAGQLYSVSFWIREFEDTSDDPIIGAVIAPSPASISWGPQTVSLSPQVTVHNVGETYQEVKYCFTPQNSGVHYMSFGAFSGYGGMSNVYYFIDDVSITQVPQGTLLPAASLAIPQTTYCTGDIIIADGSASTDEDGYTWEVYALNQGQEILEYSSGLQTGQAGTFDVSSVLGVVYPGECYRVYLLLDGLCPDETYVEFCYVDPEIDFIYNGDPVCEGSLTNLSVTGDNGWTYTWYEGSNVIGGGVGAQAMAVTPTIGNSTYTVQVETPEGCTFSKSITLTVHAQNNLAPWSDGVYGSGEYTVYVPQGGNVYFWSNVYNDNNSENLIYDFDFVGLPSIAAHIHNEPSPNGGVWDFSFNPNNSPSGTYSFTLTANDRNACAEGVSTFTFNIVVICDQCPVCVSYEDRGPAPQVPLPQETKAGDCINAGLAQPVLTGNANVLFQAGNEINLGSNFTAGTGFQAVIAPSTCVTDCEDCCTDWAGFTYDPVQNYMNFNDGIPQTSIWQMTDINHPFCAFSAKGYDLSILNQYQNVLYESSANFSTCCPFESPSPENPITNSSIWWDGYTTNMFGNQVHPEDGTYYYLVTLYGCDGQNLTLQGFITILSGSGMIAMEGDDTSTPEREEMNSETPALLKEMNELNAQITLAPNPAQEYIQIMGTEENDVNVTVLDANGRIVAYVLAKGGHIDVSGLAKGMYYVHIYIGNSYVTKKFVKQ